jgi:hypothetical protein
VIFRKAASMAAAVAALAAAAAVCVVALAYALFAALAPQIGAAWASAGVAGAAALLLAFGGLLLARRAHPRKREEDRDVASRVLDLARDKPIVAVAAVAAAGLVALKNPKITAAVLGAFMAGRAPKK